MTQTLSRIDNIRERINPQVAGGIGVTPSRGLVVQSVDQAMELAKLMSVSEQAVPKHLRGVPGACLAVCIQGYEWGINPFALANKSYVVNDRLAYEAALYHAVVQSRAPIKGRIKCDYKGDGPTRQCRVWAALEDDDGTVEYTTPEFQRIPVKNSPLWKSDPDQQLFYFAVRSFSRRHFPDVMMGIYTVDELMDSPAMQATPEHSAASLNRLIQPTPAPVESPKMIEHAAPITDARETINTSTGEVTPEPEADHTTPEAPEAVQPAQDERPAPKMPAPMLSHAALVGSLESAAQDFGIPSNGLSAWMAEAFKGLDEKKLTALKPRERIDVWNAFVAWAKGQS